MKTAQLSKRNIYQMVAQEMPWESNLNRPDRDTPIAERTRLLLEKSEIEVTRDGSFMIIKHPSLNSTSYKEVEDFFNWFKNRNVVKHTGKGVYKVVDPRFAQRLKVRLKSN